MPGSDTGSGPGHDELTARVFRALYPEFDLRTVVGAHVVVPRVISVVCGPSLGDVARQISDHAQRRAGRTQ
jgi:hypothetical protein